MGGSKGAQGEATGKVHFEAAHASSSGRLGGRLEVGRLLMLGSGCFAYSLVGLVTGTKCRDGWPSFKRGGPEQPAGSISMLSAVGAVHMVWVGLA